MAKLTTKQVQIFADLARIDLREEELERFSGELESILNYVEQINEVDVSDIEFASHVDDFVGERMREDVSGEALSSEQIFKNAADRKKGNNFLTSKIIQTE